MPAALPCMLSIRTAWPVLAPGVIGVWRSSVDRRLALGLLLLFREYEAAAKEARGAAKLVLEDDGADGLLAGNPEWEKKKALFRDSFSGIDRGLEVAKQAQLCLLEELTKAPGTPG